MYENIIYLKRNLKENAFFNLCFFKKNNNLFDEI